MKARLASCKEWITRNKWYLVGAIFVTMYVFSSYFLGFVLSFTNVNYTFAPFNSTQTETLGPLLSDVADNHYPTIVRNFYSDEGFSLWESDMALGRSSNTIAEFMNPMEWVYVLPLGLAIFLKAFSEFAIGFIAMYLFLQSLGVKKFSATLASVTYIFSAAIVAWLGWSHSDVAVWAPLLFFAIEKLIETLQVKYMFLVALVVYMMLIVGMPTYAAYFMYLAGIYIIVFTVKRHWKQKRNIFIVGGMFAVGVILAILISLPYTSSLLGSVVGNGYMGSRTSYGEAQLSWGYLRSFLFPYFRDNMTVHFNEATMFVGVISVVLFPFAFCNLRQKKRSLFFILATVILLLLIFTGVLNVVYTKIPMISTSLKYRVIVLLMFTLSTLTGLTLNDCIVNKDYYRQKPWLLAVAVVWIVGSLLLIAKDLIEPYFAHVVWMGVFMLFMAACVALLVKKDYKPVYAVLAIAVVANSASFAMRHLPWVEAEAGIIPAATDSVEYMMENTSEEQRIVGLGVWTFFPNTPSYYDLNDIRTHGFEATNADMEAYYTAVSSDAYVTNTRLAFETIDNYELLKYMGVKYLYGETVGDLVPVGSDAPHSKAYGAVASHSALSQRVHLDDSPSMLSILFATYGSTPQSGSEAMLTLTNTQGENAFRTSIPVEKIRDNAYVTILLDTQMPIPEGDYELSLSFGDLKEDTITVWMKEQEGSVVSGSNGDVPGAMAMFATYNSENYRVVYGGDDGMVIAQMEEYADKVELIESLTVCDSEESVLSAMSQEYVDNGAFLCSEDSALAYDRPLESGEGVFDVQYTDSVVTMSCTSHSERYLVLNDYYDSDWKAYVNGKEVPVERINYLMRGIRLEAGENMTVEFRYEPRTLYMITAFSLAVLVTTVVLFVFRRKLQSGVDKLAG